MGELFIYKCKSCGYKFEMYHRISEPVHEIICPECNGTEVLRIASEEHRGAIPEPAKDKNVENKQDE